MEVHDGQDSGWQNRGMWTVGDDGPPAPVSVAPASGSGSTQTFRFQFSSPRGFASIQTASVVIGTNASGVNSCYLNFVRAGNAIYLANDAASAWLPPASLGTNATVENSQCSINAATSSSSGSGSVLTVDLNISFKAVYTGAKTIFMLVYDGQNSGWASKGSWTATQPSVFGPVSVTPGSGSGTSQTFAFLFHDPAGVAAISSTSMIIGSTLAGNGNCYLYYARASNAIFLASDAGSAWLAPGVLGSAVTIQNSQCSIQVAASSASGSGTQLTVNLAIAFKPAYSGNKTIYMEAYDGQDSGWHNNGTWVVP